MRTPGKLRAATLVALLAAGGCHDSNAPQPIAPRTLQIVGSASEFAIRGDDAPSPLRVRVIGTDGKAFAGTTVHWGAAPGAALVDPQTSTTDPLGEASARVSELAITGPIGITASVENLAPVSFTIFTADPCLNVNAHLTRVDSVMEGVLRPIDCRIDDRYYDFYMFSLAAQRAVTIDAKSQAFAPAVLAFEFSTGDGWGAKGDDTHIGEVSLRMILPAGFNAVGIAGYSSAVTGPYTLTVRSATEDASGCDTLLVARGIDTQQRLDAGDCSSAPDPGHHDSYSIFLWQGQSVTFTESSTDFVPRLRVSNTSGTVAEESTGNSDAPATIAILAPANDYYLVVASSLRTAEGAYSLSITDGAPTNGPLLSRTASGAGHQNWQPTPRLPR